MCMFPWSDWLFKKFRLLRSWKKLLLRRWPHLRSLLGPSWISRPTLGPEEFLEKTQSAFHDVARLLRVVLQRPTRCDPVQGFRVKEGLGFVIFYAVLARITRNLALPWLKNPVLWSSGTQPPFPQYPLWSSVVLCITVCLPEDLFESLLMTHPPCCPICSWH